MKLAFPDAGDEPTTTTHRRAYDLSAEGSGPGVNGPLLIVADLRTPGLDAGTVPALSERLAADPGIALVGEPQTAPPGMCRPVSAAQASPIVRWIGLSVLRRRVPPHLIPSDQPCGGVSDRSPGR